MLLALPDGPLIFSTSGSFFWKSLIRLRPIFSSSSKFQISSGKRISFWYDVWDGQPLAGSLFGNLQNRNISLYEAKQRPYQLFPRPLTFQHNQVVQALSLLTFVQGNDKLIWNLSASGQFTVKSIYKVLSQGGKVASDLASIWRASVTPSMRLFFYLFLNHRLLTHDVMQRRNLCYQPGCVMCDRQHCESAMYLFFSCPYADQIWSTLASFSGYDILTTADSLPSTYRCSFPTVKDRQRPWLVLFITALWLMWRERNTRTFQHAMIPAALLANKMWEEANLYLRHCK